MANKFCFVFGLLSLFVACSSGLNWDDCIDNYQLRLRPQLYQPPAQSFMRPQNFMPIRGFQQQPTFGSNYLQTNQVRYRPTFGMNYLQQNVRPNPTFQNYRPTRLQVLRIPPMRTRPMQPTPQIYRYQPPRFQPNFDMRASSEAAASANVGGYGGYVPQIQYNQPIRLSYAPSLDSYAQGNSQILTRPVPTPYPQPNYDLRASAEATAATNMGGYGGYVPKIQYNQPIRVNYAPSMDSYAQGRGNAQILTRPTPTTYQFITPVISEGSAEATVETAVGIPQYISTNNVILPTQGMGGYGQVEGGANIGGVVGPTFGTQYEIRRPPTTPSWMKLLETSDLSAPKYGLLEGTKQAYVDANANAGAAYGTGLTSGLDLGFSTALAKAVPTFATGFSSGYDSSIGLGGDGNAATAGGIGGILTGLGSGIGSSFGGGATAAAEAAASAGANDKSDIFSFLRSHHGNDAKASASASASAFADENLRPLEIMTPQDINGDLEATANVMGTMDTLIGARSQSATDAEKEDRAKSLADAKAEAKVEAGSDGDSSASAKADAAATAETEQGDTGRRASTVAEADKVEGESTEPTHADTKSDDVQATPATVAEAEASASAAASRRRRGLLTSNVRYFAVY